MKKRLFRLAAACAVGAAVFGAAPSARGAATTVKGTFRCSYQKQVVSLVNQYRAGRGLPALKMTKALTDAAMVRAAETSHFFSHDRPNGEDCFSIIPREYLAAENIAYGQETPDEVATDWINSKPHRKNIVSTDFTHIGIGCFERDGVCFWVQVFSDTPGGSASETRTGDKGATAKIALDTASRSSVTFDGGSASSYCTITFNANGGTGEMARQKVKVGVKFTLRKNAFTRSGYVFRGWAQSKSGSVVVGDEGTGTADNAGTLALYARWAKENYKVAFCANGGTGKMAAQKMTYGKAKKLAANKFKRKGYAFKGWAKSKALAKEGKVAYKNGKAVKNLVKNGKTVKLYAVWKKKTAAK